jgi:cystinosin
MNWKRKSVIGLSFDYLCFNIIGFSAYAAFNSAFYWNKSIQFEYSSRNHGKNNLVELNDVFFAFHATLLTGITVLVRLF